jgi:CRP-like cAMP-binding protein
MNVQDAIRESYLAQGFSDEQLGQLFAIAEMRSYEDGEPILRQFDEAQDLLILASGRANILTVIGEPIGVVKPGMPLGEISFLDNKPRSVSVVSSGPSEAVVLPAAPLRQILQDRPDIALRALLNISRVLCARLRAANNNIAALLAIDESEATLSRG